MVRQSATAPLFQLIIIRMLRILSPRYLLPILLALSLLISSEGRSVHEYEHQSWTPASSDSISKQLAANEICLQCLAYAPLAASLLPGALSSLALLCATVILLRAIPGSLISRFEVRFRSRAPPFLI